MDIRPLLEQEPYCEKAAKNMQEDLNQVHLTEEETHAEKLHYKFEC